MTRERVLVVFFFCSDLALMALQQQAVQVFRNLMRWSNEYITGGLTSWVRNQGGWVLTEALSLSFSLRQYLLITGFSAEPLSQHTTQSICHCSLHCCYSLHGTIHSQKLLISFCNGKLHNGLLNKFCSKAPTLLRLNYVTTIRWRKRIGLWMQRINGSATQPSYCVEYILHITITL